MFNLFNTAKPAEPAATPAAPAGTSKIADATPSVKPVETDGTAPNGVVPDNVKTPESPLDNFKDLWQNDPNAKPATSEYAPSQLDTNKLQEMMSNVDFSSAITPESLAAIQAGGEEASKAFAASLNSVAQQTLMQSIMVANKITQAEVQKAVEATKSSIPSMVKNQTLTENLNKANPILNNPAVAPMIDMMKSQLATKYPTASAEELTNKAQEFVLEMGKAFTPTTEQTPSSDIANETDWEKFLEPNQ
jgi:hypothetical protein